MTIFQKSVITKHLDNLGKEQVEKAYKKFRENYSPTKIEEIKSKINQLQNEINSTDKEIDQMVYELYGLTEEEVGIVEKQ